MKQQKWETLHQPTEQGDATWGTPCAFFGRLNAEFAFHLDLAASDYNAKCPLYWTVEDDALSRVWPVGPALWLNPPYGRTISQWMEKVCAEVARGATVVVLIFARTDTAWWHRYAFQAAEWRFVRGRLAFEDRQGKAGNPSPVPSVVLVYRPGHVGPPVVSAIDATVTSSPRALPTSRILRVESPLSENLP